MTGLGDRFRFTTSIQFLIFFGCLLLYHHVQTRHLLCQIDYIQSVHNVAKLQCSCKFFRCYFSAIVHFCTDSRMLRSKAPFLFVMNNKPRKHGQLMLYFNKLQVRLQEMGLTFFAEDILFCILQSHLLIICTLQRRPSQSMKRHKP